MKVLFLASEATPFIKVGGLADVAGELPPVLHQLGVDIRLGMPFYPSIRSSQETRKITSLNIPYEHGEQSAEISMIEREDGFVYLVDGEAVRAGEGVYADPAQDAVKFTFTALAALMACEQLDWRPDILHANDWHMAPAIAWLHERRKQHAFWQNTATILTVHNLPYMGAGGEAAMAAYGIPPSKDERLPLWAKHMPLPMGLATADWISTVSPSYAEEIQTPEFGCGLEVLLTARREWVVGILNGIEPTVWDPERDPALQVRYSRAELKRRAENKRALQAELGLPEDADLPLLGMVTRLDWQKGVDLTLAALEGMLDVPWQAVLLGTGDRDLERQACDFAIANPQRMCAVQRFDLQLSRRMYAGCDVMLIPSRYEPCGLVQMIAMRYGSVPVVRATGGLKDSVEDFQLGGVGTGFVFDQPVAEGLAEALRRACKVYADRRRWVPLQKRGMAKDFSWQKSAEKYIELYHRAGEHRATPM
jgi:starch synthase